MQRDIRCKEHPEYNTKKKLSGSSANCAVCNGLHYGSKPTGYFMGENDVIKKSDINRARTKIGPLSLEQFGHIRHSFGYNYSQNEGSSWHADEKTRMIYLKKELSLEIRKKLSKKYKCKVKSIFWTEPRMTSLSALNLPNGEASTLLMIFGESNKEVSLTVKVGMSIEEVQGKISELLSELFDVPKDIIKKTKASKKQ